MHKFFSTMFLAVLLLAPPVAQAFDSGPFAGRGIVRAVRSIDGIVILENHEGFELLNLDENTTVQDAQGVFIALRDLPLGSQVEYIGRYWQGLSFALTVRVSPRPFMISAR